MNTKQTRSEEAIEECKTCIHNEFVHLRNITGLCMNWRAKKEPDKYSEALIKCDKCKKPTAKSLIIPEVDRYGFKVIKTNICYECNEKRRQFMLGGKYSWEEEHAENKKELT